MIAGLRHHWQGRVRRSLGCEVRSVGEDVSILAKARGVKADMIHLACHRSAVSELPLPFSSETILGGRDFRFFPRKFGARQAVFGIGGKRVSISTGLRGLRHDVSPLTPESVGHLQIAVEPFRCVRFGFQFETPREGPARGLPFGQHKPVVRPKLPRVPPSPRPEPANKEDLKERLKWILTPPIHELLSDPELAIPKPLRPYQVTGIKWLLDRDTGLLADEMGLGKTAQAVLAARLLWKQRSVKSILVVCPKSLITTWKDEFCTWWPQSLGHVMSPTQDRRWFLRLGTPAATVKIINYEGLARELDWLKEQRFGHDLVIIDEAQRIKNPLAQTSQAVKALHAKRRWALTGTPLENRIEDLLSVFEFIRPGLMEGDVDPERIGAKPIEVLFNRRGVIGVWVEPQEVRRRISPYMLRRRREDVLKDLPDKDDQDIGIDLTESQRRAYDLAESDGVVALNAMGDTISVLHVFQLIMRLRQLCNFDPATGESAKMERLVEDMEEIRASGRKALVFCQFVGAEFGLKRIAAALQDFGPLQLHGEVAPNRRSQIIAAFGGDVAASVLLLNYQVGGVGLNLQMANYVFLFDRWWNPAVEDQAVGRVHRLGQSQKVIVRRFFCRNTIEETILETLAKKRRLFREVIDESQPAEAMGLTEEEIFSLFNLKVRPRGRRPGLGAALEDLSAEDFELLVARVYEKQGYAATVTPVSHDAGVDVYAEKTGATGRELVAIQCKRQKDNVGRPVLQGLWGVLSADPRLTRGDVVTTAGFSNEAKAFAEGKRLTLIDGQALKSLIGKLGVDIGG